MKHQILSQNTLASLLPGVDLVIRETTASTSTDARKLAQGGLSRPLLVTAEEQSGGRGRQGRLFHSPRGGLYMTLALPCGRPLSETVGVTACAAVALHRAIEQTTGAVCGIKWVNDLYLGGGKVSGILAESINRYEDMTSQILLIGMGVNLTTAPILTDSDIRAMSLTDAGFSCDKTALCAAVVRELLDVQKNRFSLAPYIAEYRRHSIVLGQNVTFSRNGETSSGRVTAILDTGALSVDCGGQSVLLDSGEIHLRLTPSI